VKLCGEEAAVCGVAMGENSGVSVRSGLPEASLKIFGELKRVGLSSTREGTSVVSKNILTIISADRDPDGDYGGEQDRYKEAVLVDHGTCGLVQETPGGWW
jgi:hypothetical protein